MADSWLKRLSSDKMKHVASKAKGQDRRRSSHSKSRSASKYNVALSRRRRARPNKKSAAWSKWQVLRLPNWGHDFLIRHRGAQEQIVRAPRQHHSTPGHHGRVKP